ncbi:MAG: hypothetical protein ABIU09_06745 [Pyrinomonadaceae bacterium]
MPQQFASGDFLIFQLESGYGLLRVLATDEGLNGPIWHLTAYRDLFLDVEMADAALDKGEFSISHPHIALTNRAFESTQVARLRNRPLTEDELVDFNQLKQNKNLKISDRSVRLMIGLR